MISSSSSATSILIEHGRVWQSGTPASILDQHEAGSTQTGRSAFIPSASADFGAGFFQHASSWGSKRSACLALFSNLAFFGVGAPRAESPSSEKDPEPESRLRSLNPPQSMITNSASLSLAVGRRAGKAFRSWRPKGGERPRRVERMNTSGFLRLLSSSLTWINRRLDLIR